MEHMKELFSVPLASLVLSRFNVRRHSIGQVEELAALIEAHGLLHRRALLLQQRGRLAKKHEVPCELVPPERSLEVSLAENRGREAMHPADEFEAFKALIDEVVGDNYLGRSTTTNLAGLKA